MFQSRRDRELARITIRQLAQEARSLANTLDNLDSLLGLIEVGDSENHNVDHTPIVFDLTRPVEPQIIAWVQKSDRAWHAKELVRLFANSNLKQLNYNMANVSQILPRAARAGKLHRVAYGLYRGTATPPASANHKS
jgi:hypothetical protein